MAAGARRNAAVSLELPINVAREFEVLGRRWAPQILFLLLQRPARFTELERAVPGLTKRVMVERLRELQAAGLVERRVEPGPPLGSSYALTPDGEALRAPFEGLGAWAEERAHRCTAPA
jgi:DNA-binding HxlR family transcriptional regulator